MDPIGNCPACGLPILRPSSFCPDCGKPLGREASTDALLRRPGLITFFAALHFVAALLTIPAIPALVLLAPDDRWGKAIAVSVALFALLCSALYAWIGWGLWKLKSWARLAWIAEAACGLLAVPFGTIVSVLILLYLFRPGVKLLFAGRDETELSAEERWALLQDRSSAVLVAMLAVTVAGSLAVGALVSAIAIPNLLNAIDRGRTKRTLIDLQAIAGALEHYRVDHGGYPVARNIEALAATLEPPYLPRVPLEDGWEHPFVAESSAAGFVLLSTGKDGVVEENPPGGYRTEFDADIVLSNEGFFQRPDLSSAGRAQPRSKRP